MDIKNLYRSPQSIAAIEDGAWIGGLPNMGDLELKVRGLKSRLVRELYESKVRAVPNDKRDRKTREPVLSERERIAVELLHEVVLLDWRGLTDGGKPVKYDPALAKVWCMDPSYRQFADAVTHAAMMVDEGAQETAEEVVGNLPGV